jgi:Short C-terminal domain
MLLRPFRIAPMMFSGAGVPAPQAVQAPRPDVVQQLKGLKALRDDGALTPEEFERAKRKVLGR